ncbi:MAG: creatininase family protein [Deltaproteobacteria bacterium]|nr:creatininase family protein [Deltaproteobacteria bacterium]
MAILRYENLTHIELSGLERDKTVVIFCVAPLVQHGPHLPLGTDAITAEFFSTQLAKRLEATRPNWNFVMFPTFFAGSDTLTFTGTVEVRPTTLRALLMDCCKQLARDGFRQIVLLGTHGGPRHMVVLEEVAEKLRWRYRTRAISASAKLLHDIMKGQLIERIADRMEKNGQALSAGEREGLKWKLRRNSGKKAGDGLGHLGTPALARVEIGQAAVELLLDDTTPLVEKFLSGENVNREFRSKFYFIPFFRTDFKVLAVMTVYPILIFIAWLFLSQSIVGIFISAFLPFI